MNALSALVRLAVVGLLSVVCAPLAWTQSGDIVIERADVPRMPLPVAPGEGADWTVVVRNDGDVTVPRTTLRAYAPVLPLPPLWQFESPVHPQCGPVEFGFEGVFRVWTLTLVDLAPGQRLACTYRLLRAANAYEDLVLGWWVIEPVDDPDPAGNWATWLAGSLARLELTATPTCDGDPAPGIHHVRVALRNRGPSPVDALRFGTCFNNFGPGFLIDGDIDGGCGPRHGAPGLCFGSGIGWTMAATAAGETSSCLLALSLPAQPGTGSLAFPIRILEPYASGSLRVRDLNPEAGWAQLSVASPPLNCAAGAGAPEPVPALRGLGWLLLALAVLVVTLRAAFPATRRDSA